MLNTPVDGGGQPLPEGALSSEPVESGSEALELADEDAPARPRRGSRSLGRIILATICLLLTAALVATGVYSYQTIQSTNKTLNETRLALAKEQTAHRSADAWASGLSACIVALNADEASLAKMGRDLRAMQARTLKAGDLEAARLTYETALLEALTDEHKAVVNASWASTDAEWTAVNMLGLQGENEMKQAAALKTQLDSLVTEYQSSADEVSAEAPAIEAQMARTSDLCGAGPGSSAAPAVPRASLSANP
jgi:hypothetical protein